MKKRRNGKIISNHFLQMSENPENSTYIVAECELKCNTFCKNNPEKTPKYIYVCWIFIPTSVTSGHQINKPRANNLVEEITKTFNCEVSELSNGFLLTLK